MSQTLTQSDAALSEAQLQEQAETLADTFEETFNEDSDKIETQIDTYNGLFLNFKNVSELYEKYGKEIAPSNIIPGSKYYPVTFQIIPWENNYIVNPIYEKNNIQTR